jgi:diguanylate cyclase (GGDEF)-like protein
LLILTLPATIFLSTININYASISSVLLASISLYFAQKGIGTFSQNPSMVNNLLNLNYFMASHIILVLLVGILFREKQEAIEQLQKMAHFDALTGLPNRHMLREEIHHAVSMSDQYGDRSAICYIDVDHFKSINDTLGHHIGDEVLRIISSRIQAEITARDALLRIGGDEFLLILNKIEKREMIQQILKNISESIHQPISIENKQFSISCSIGIAFCPDHGITIKELMETADKAMYYAKNSGRDCVSYA